MFMKARYLWVLIAAIVNLAGLSAIAQGVLPIRLSDDFVNRPFLGTAAWVVGSLSNATSEADEPLIDGVSSGQTVWGTWTAPSNGIVTLSPEAETFSPLLTVYTGDALNTLSLVASNNYLICYEDGVCGCHWRERNQITFHVARGQAYQICVDSAIITDAAMTFQSGPAFTNSNGSIIYGMGWRPIFTTNVLVGGDVILNLQFTPAPPNDDFINRVKLAGARTSILASNAGATKELGERDHLGNPGGSSVWYSWTAPAAGRVTLTTNELAPYAPSSSGDGGSFWSFSMGTGGWPLTCGNEIDQNPPPVFYPVFAAYTGTAVDALTPANNLPMSLDAFPDGVEFDAVKGRTYQIAFDGNMGTAGEIPLYLALTTPAANNNFYKRIPLHGVSVVATSYNAGATHQPGEPVFGASAGKTVWWIWTAPVGGTVAIDLGGSDYSFPVAVFTGLAPASLQTVAEGSGGLAFQAVRGKTYQIAVSDCNGLTGSIKLSLQAPLMDLPLFRTTRTGRTAILTYVSAANETIALLHSTDDVNWKIIQMKPTTGNLVQFPVTEAPTHLGPFYRAILFDRK